MAMTVSEITIDFVKDWLGISDGDETALNACLTAAKKQAMSYSGLTAAELDEHEDITFAVLGILNDLYTSNRPDTAQTAMNTMSQKILNMYSQNLL